MKSKKVFNVLAMVIVLCTLLAGCSSKSPAENTADSETGNSAEQTAAESTGNTSNAASELVIGLSAEPTTMDPHIQSGQATRMIKQQIYRGLFSYGDGEESIHNELADSYEISEDNLTYTFKLKEAKFHDGSDVTAEDVVFSIQRIMDEQTGATFGSDFRNVIESCTAVDEKTVQIVLKSPDAAFLELLCLPESVVVSEAWCESHDNDLNANPMGCGPYQFDSWDRGREIIVTASGDYYKETPKSSTIRFVFYTDDTTRANALRTGDVNLIDYVPAKEAIAFGSSQDVQLDVTVAPFMCIQMNCTKGSPLADAKVRQAIAYAVDRDGVISSAFMSRGVAIYGFPTIVGQTGYDGAYDDYFSYDPDKAKALLAEAGYPDGFSCKLLATSTYAMHEQTALIVQDSLAKIGIDVEVELPDWSTRIERSNTGDYDMMISGTAGNIVDMDWVTNYYQSGDVRMNSCPGFGDELIDQYLSEGRETLDPDERAVIYNKFRERALELSPFVFLNYREQIFAYGNNVKGFNNLDGVLTYCSGITLENTYVEE